MSMSEREMREEAERALRDIALEFYPRFDRARIVDDLRALITHLDQKARKAFEVARLVSSTDEGTNSWRYESFEDWGREQG